MCQRLLTVLNRACGGALERLERRVRLEGLGEVLGGLCIEAVARQTANERQIAVSAAADSGIQACSGVLEVLEGRVRLEALG